MKNKISYYFNQAIDFANKNLRKVIFFLVAILVIYTLILSDYGLIEYFKNRMIAKELKVEIQKEKHISDSLSHRIYQLKNDTLEIEKIARELYGMVKPNETLYIYKQETRDKDEK